MPLGRPIGELMLSSIQLALEEAGGQAGDVMIELLVLNTSEEGGNSVSTNLEREVALQAVENSTVVAYIGFVSSAQAKESIPILNQAGTTQIAFTTSWLGLTKPGFGPGEPQIYYPTGQRTFFGLFQVMNYKLSLPRGGHMH